MKFSGAIFDMDGTLIDSMHIWSTHGEDFLRMHGFEPEPHEHNLFLSMSMEEFSSYIRDKYHMNFSVCEIRRDINIAVGRKYENISVVNPGVREYLTKLKASKIPMCVATMTDRVIVEKTLRRCNIIHFFDKIFTCSEVGASKTEPDIFNEACAWLGTSPSETAVFEDSLFAAETAKRAGFKVVGVYDEFSAHNEKSLRDISDLYIKSFRELL